MGIRIYSDMEESEEHQTLEHIRKVQEKIAEFKFILTKRAINHDKSKLEPPERRVFAQFPDIPKFGSPEYEKRRASDLKEVLEHHYRFNRHHPEHYNAGFEGITLLDLVEMICDWSAATEKSGGKLIEHVEILGTRFNIDQQLLHIIQNTIKELKW